MNMNDCKEAIARRASPAKFILGLAAVFCLCCGTAVYADTPLQCYKGDRNEGQYVGEIIGANLQSAAQECNTTYGDCNGMCYGCYVDSETNSEVCVDSQGNRFTR